MRSFFFYILAGIFALVGIFLISNISKGIDYGKPYNDRVNVYVSSRSTLEKVLEGLPECSIINAKTYTVKVPDGQVQMYQQLFTHRLFVASATLVYPLPKFSFEKYGQSLKKQLTNYSKGNFGEMFKRATGQHIPITDFIGLMIKRTMTYLIPGLATAIGVGTVMALAASIWRRWGKLTDSIHALFTGIPDFFLISLIQLGAVYASKLTTKRLILVIQLNDEVPFLIPYLTILLVPCVLIYGTLRLAIHREMSAAYVRTAYSKGIPRYRIILRHILPNIWEDLLAIMPRAVSAAISGMVIAEVICWIVGLGGYIINPFYVGLDTLPFTCMLLGAFAVAVQLLCLLLRKWLVVRTKEAG